MKFFGIKNDSDRHGFEIRIESNDKPEADPFSCLKIYIIPPIVSLRLWVSLCSGHFRLSTFFLLHFTSKHLPGWVLRHRYQTYPVILMQHVQSWSLSFLVMIMLGIDQVVIMVHFDMLWHPVSPISALPVLHIKRE